MSLTKKCENCDSKAKGKTKINEEFRYFCGSQCLGDWKAKMAELHQKNNPGKSSQASSVDASVEHKRSEADKIALVAPAADVKSTYDDGAKSAQSNDATHLSSSSGALPPMPPLRKIVDDDDSEYSDGERDADASMFTVRSEMPALIPISEALAAAGRNNQQSNDDEYADMPGMVPIEEVLPHLRVGGQVPSKVDSLRGQLRDKLQGKIDQLIESSVPDSIDDNRWSAHWIGDELHYKCTLHDVPDDMVELTKHRLAEHGYKVLSANAGNETGAEDELAPIGLDIAFSLN